MAASSRDFQIFAKPAGPACNLACAYCYYLKKKQIYPEGDTFRMTDDILERYIAQHIGASPGPEVRFSWHGGEPTLAGLGFFRRVVELQRKHRSSGKRIVNGMQTNGVLLNGEWCRFLAEEGFAVGLSLDGPRRIHDRFRIFGDGKPTFDRVMHGYELLKRHGIWCDILCVVNACSVRHPLEIYRFFRKIGARYVSFLPMVESCPDAEDGVSPLTVPAEDWGEFLCDIFDEWVSGDIGRIKVQIFEEAAATAFGREHALCIFRPVCGDIPVVEYTGDFFSCDHFVDAEHRVGNIRETPLAELIESPAQRAFGQAKKDTLPRYCRSCEVREMCNGECPKNRFIATPDGERGLNYLCPGYRRFFTHCRPFVAEVAAQWRARTVLTTKPEPRGKSARTTPQPGRNDPCPCGSGLKYKKCCMKR